MASLNMIKRYSIILITLISLAFVLKELFYYLNPNCVTSVATSIQNIKNVRIHIDGSDLRGDQKLETPGPSEEPIVQIKRSSRLILHGGRCVDKLSNDMLGVGHCDPNISQSFTLDSKGYLRHDRTGLCVRPSDDNNIIASVGVCDTEFIVQGSSLALKSSGYCLSPITGSKTSVLYPCLGDHMGFTADCDPKISDISFIEDKAFQIDRKALSMASPNAKCDFKACGLNAPATAVELLKPKFLSRCKHPFDCVTVITKTARRPYLVTRLAKSIRTFLGYDLRIISYDDGPNDYGQEIWDDIGEYPHLQYLIGDDEDMGISLGRNLAIEKLVTKYFLLTDDDHVFNDKTNIEKMVEILDTTDATLIGGKFEGFMKFAGAMKFGYFHGRQEFAIFSGYCERDLSSMFPNCEQCDSTSNIFLAKVEHVREIGGWSVELKIAEHADFFVKLKAFKKKVVYCDDIEIINQQEAPEDRSKSYQRLRYDKGRKNRMFRLMNGRYNVNGLFWCSDYELVDGELVCVTTKHKIGYC